MSGVLICIDLGEVVPGYASRLVVAVLDPTIPC